MTGWTRSAVRPWIAINAHFQRELQLFYRVVTLTADPREQLTRDEVNALVLHTSTPQALPRLDFHATLVPDIVGGQKTITMRLESDVENDIHSDLHSVVAHTTVIATTALPDTRTPFALLRVDCVVTTCLADLSPDDVAKSGFLSAADVLQVLRQFYPHVTETTSLLMLHFQCIGPLDEDNK